MGALNHRGAHIGKSLQGWSPVLRKFVALVPDRYLLGLHSGIFFFQILGRRPPRCAKRIYGAG